MLDVFTRRVSCCGSLYGYLVSLVMKECIRREIFVAGLYRVILVLDVCIRRVRCCGSLWGDLVFFGIK